MEKLLLYEGFCLLYNFPRTCLSSRIEKALELVLKIHALQVVFI